MTLNELDRLHPDFEAAKIVLTRHAAHALARRGIGLLDVMNMLRASAAIRRDPTSGHFVLRHDDFRVVLDFDEATKTATILTVFWGDMRD